MPLKITNLVSDSIMIIKIRKLADTILRKDPNLENKNNLIIHKKLKKTINKKEIWEYIS